MDAAADPAFDIRRLSGCFRVFRLDGAFSLSRRGTLVVGAIDDHAFHPPWSNWQSKAALLSNINFEFRW
jgi:hypothetical protein